MSYECPKCNSRDIATERRLDGDSRCVKCGFKDKTDKFLVVGLGHNTFDDKIQETHQHFKSAMKINELEAELFKWKEKYIKLAELCAENKCKCQETPIEKQARLQREGLGL